MTHLFPRHTKANHPIVHRGDGVYLFDTNGKQYLDGSGGAAVSCLGHNDQDIINAIKAQIDAVPFAHTGFFTSQPAEDLASELIARAPEGLDRVYFVSGGSEANESALKLARQYFLEIGQPQRHRIIARRQSYHGNTLGALAAGGNIWRREPFQPLMVETSHIAPCYEYRDRKVDESAHAYGQRVANELEAEILRVGPDQVMAFFAEPVVGATAGAVPAVAGYFKQIRKICDRYGVLLVLDEVMCGMGRTGTLFACEQDGIAPDILTIAKGLGAGYQPIGAMLCTGEIYRAIEQGTGFFQHGHTYNGHPTATAAALAVLHKLTGAGNAQGEAPHSEQGQTGLLPRVRDISTKLQAALHEAFDGHPHIGDIRGRGLFLGLEFVKDRDTKAPFDPSNQIAKAVRKATFEAGLICYPMSGTIDGVHGDHLLLAPSFIFEDAHIEELIAKLQSAFGVVFANSTREV